LGGGILARVTLQIARLHNDGVANPDWCEAMNCCFEQTEDDARMDCLSRYGATLGYLDSARDTIQESCVASGK
jgi:hypothetical protein